MLSVYFMAATQQLMKSVTADVIAGLGSIPGVIRNYMSDTFQPGNITDRTSVVEKF